MFIYEHWAHISRSTARDVYSQNGISFCYNGMFKIWSQKLASFDEVQIRLSFDDKYWLKHCDKNSNEWGIQMHARRVEIQLQSIEFERIYEI